MARELDDAILMLRTNQLEIGTWLLKTRGDAAAVLAVDAVLDEHRAHWFVRETIGMLRRTLARLDVSSRTLFALIEPGSCFAGTLFELALAADRSYMAAGRRRSTLSPLNFGTYPRVDQLARIDARFYREAEPVARARAAIGNRLSASDALDLGLVTVAPDDLDWADEIRIALEERASLSPDALTGMEANLRFGVDRDDGDARLRPAVRVAELDLLAAECRRRERRAEGLRQRQQSAVRLGTGMSIEHDRLRRFRTTSTLPPTRRCSARSSTGSRTSSTGGARWGPTAAMDSTSTCAPRSASSATAGRTSAT